MPYRTEFRVDPKTRKIVSYKVEVPAKNKKKKKSTNKPKPDPSMLGSGAAAKAGSALKNRSSFIARKVHEAMFGK